MSAASWKFDAAGFALALVIHVSALLYLYLAPAQPSRRITTVEVEIRKVKPPPIPELPPEPPKPPEPEKPPEPPKKLVRKLPRPAETPPTSKPLPEPPKEPPKPVFGIDASQTGGQGISVPVGNTTLADPAKRPKVTQVPPLPPAQSVPSGGEYHPLAEEELKQLPEIDNDECGAAMKQKWSESEANASGLTGEVVLRIELDARGKPRTIKKVKGISIEVDNIAIGFLRFDKRCRFRPAIGKDGKAADFVIERYVVHFERE